MSVQMVENWARILGAVQQVENFSELDDFDQVTILVEQVESVENSPNLVSTYLQEEDEPLLPVLMPVQVISEYSITVGVVVECRVRRAGPDRVFVRRDTVVVHRPG